MNWISVKERLPPQDGTQFIGYSPTNENAPIYVLIFDPGVKYLGELERCSRGPSYREASGECYFTWEPTHWMPLPAPPEEDSKPI